MRLNGIKKEPEEPGGPLTYYLSPERVAPEKAAAVYEEILRSPLLLSQLDSGPNILLLLNMERQIVFANRNFLRIVGLEDAGLVVGQRLGESLNCVHSRVCRGGCGTSEFCRKCGAVDAILIAQGGKNGVEECRIARNDWDALDLRVWTSPFRIGSHDLVLVVALDISNEKRRMALERVFFHDVLNIAGNIRSLSEVLPDSANDGLDFRSLLRQSSEQLIEEIMRHRELTLAETGELVVHPQQVSCRDILSGVAALYGAHPAAKGKRIGLAGGPQDLSFLTDRVLARRVLGNMVKNALEASKAGEAVTLGCEGEEGCVRLWVHNPAFIPRDVELQLFKRSFSTKGPGRGYGTYGIKIITERYLSGKVSHKTSQDKGTTFSLSLPVNGPVNEHVLIY